MFDLEFTLMVVIIAWIFVVPTLALLAFAIGLGNKEHPPHRGWLLISLAFTILWTPMLGVWLDLWDGDWFFPTGNIRSAVDLPGYRVEFVSNSIFSDISEHFDVIRSDGKRGFVFIDGDANACRDFHTKKEGTRVFFVCNDDATPSFVDTEKELVYSEYVGTITRLAEVEYSD